MQTLRFSLPTVAPFRLDLTVWSLKRREVNEVDHWDGTNYIRVFIIKNIPVKVLIRQKESRIEVVASAKKPIAELKAQLTVLLNTMLGLKLNLTQFYRLAKIDPALAPLIQKFKGVKPPRFPSLFETIANAIAFQQLSLEAGFSLLNKLTRAYGRSFREKGSTFYAFPEPQIILQCRPKDLMKLGFSRRKSESLIHLASEVHHHRETFSQLDQLSNEDLIQFFCDFKGLGRWSAEYLLLRGFGRIEVLPGDDVAIHKSIKKLLHLRKNPGYAQIKKVEQKWQPYAGLIYFHLLLQKLQQKGVFSCQESK